MRLLGKLVIAMAILVNSGLGFAKAETVSAVVSAGRTTPLRTFTLFNSTSCEYGPKPKVEFRQPENGTISVKWGVVGTIDKGVCKSKNVRGYIISYTPNRGYRGKDQGSVIFNYLKYGTSGNVAETVKFNFTVK
ncbi:MAG: hypothetical protein ACRCU5_02385 [Rhizobiaceae bacterium]